MRPEILFPLYREVGTLKGVGPRLEPALKRVAGPLVRDVLYTPPHNLVFREPATVATAREGSCQTFNVVVERHIKPARSNLPYRIRCVDETGFLHLVFFKVFGDHLERTHPVGARRLVSGKVERWQAEIQISHPDYLLDPAKAADIPRQEAIYPATEGLTSRQFRKFVEAALELAPDLPEWLDPAFKAGRGWPSWHEAIAALHHPHHLGDIEASNPARQRLGYDEFLAHMLAMARRKAVRRAHPAPPLTSGPASAAIEAALPFKLTGAQQRALAEIRGDLASGDAMSRLLQGDVGAGKTVVALLAMADAADSGFQSALMAPTEILARQHYERTAPMLEAAGVTAVLLTGRDKGSARKAKLAALADGSAMAAFGTHALFQDEVRFKNLALVTVDEQHRFGVNERKRLTDKGEGVHFLSMSATPIPRTLELTQYGDLDVSRLSEKPPGRKPIATRAVPTARLTDIAARLNEVTAGGAQAYWICPLVAESELSDLAAAEARAAVLTRWLKAPVGLVHGQMKPEEKDAVMTAFLEGKIGVLVATTVVEVGVDVPNATIMVIEHAERFGLAQLHQLRGRVGRGQGESSCILLYEAPLSDAARQRLDVLRHSEDGFEIAEKDWALRGGGDLLGLKQSGFPDYRIADPIAHRELLLAAADDAKLILTRDPHFNSPRGQALKVLTELFDWRPEKAGAAG